MSGVNPILSEDAKIQNVIREWLKECAPDQYESYYSKNVSALVARLAHEGFLITHTDNIKDD